jgi:ABC-type amino acid transport system permease subunit
MKATASPITRGRLLPLPRLEKAPWWALGLALGWVVILYSILNVATYRDTFLFISAGFQMTIRIALTAYVLAVVLGLILGLGRVI